MAQATWEAVPTLWGVHPIGSSMDEESSDKESSYCRGLCGDSNCPLIAAKPLHKELHPSDESPLSRVPVDPTRGLVGRTPHKIQAHWRGFALYLAENRHYAGDLQVA
jgi:hypothetical protein